MITNKFIPAPFALKVEVHALEIGYLVETEGHLSAERSPVLHRFALANRTAVDATIHHEVSWFMSEVDAIISKARAAGDKTPE